MDYSNRRLADQLAAEYALGTLRGGARRRLQQLLPAHPTLAAAVRAWEARVNTLAAPVPDLPPSPRVWQQLQARLFGPAQAPLRWWQQLALWRGVSGLALTAVLALGVWVLQPVPVQPPLVVVLQGTPDGAALVPAGFVASVSGDGRALVLKPLGEARLTAGQALELWAVPPGAAPRSLGLVSARAATTVLRSDVVRGAQALAVSVEPTGGSPTGAPTGPVVSVGSI
ncbi:anti-sigma factor [Roseateles sp. BYS87W]|uniref:Anti-sigma factor domain-containing protein n=1 Tax=Pelomonas baiyunensis TaxID=3299026 RepID=A0ABW7GSX1_9BURK